VATVLVPVRRLSRPLGRSAPPTSDGGRCCRGVPRPGPRLAQGWLVGPPPTDVVHDVDPAPVQKATNVLLREKNFSGADWILYTYTPLRSTYYTNVTVCVTILKRMVGAYSACKVDSHMHV